MGTVLLRRCKALCLDGVPSGSTIDVGIGADGAVVDAGATGGSRFDRIIECHGAWLSPAWIDLHVHCYHGGTLLSVRPEQVGPATGVGLAVDCGSASEANFTRLREFIIDPAPFPILAYINVSSIGLVAANPSANSSATPSSTPSGPRSASKCTGM